MSASLVVDSVVLASSGHSKVDVLAASLVVDMAAAVAWRRIPSELGCCPGPPVGQIGPWPEEKIGLWVGPN